MAEFGTALDQFLDALGREDFVPRDFIAENLTVEKCSRHFLDLLDEAARL